MKEFLEDHYAEIKAAGKLYAETEQDLIKLKIAKRGTRYVTYALGLILTTLLAVLSLLMLLITLGFVLGAELQSYGLGFLYASGLAILITLVGGLVFRKMLERPILKNLLKEMYGS